MEAKGLQQHRQLNPSRAYEALLRAGPNLNSLRQVHAHLVVSGSHRSLPFVTKLVVLACTAGSITYTRQLFFSIPNPDSFLFSSLITSCSKYHFSLDAVLFYRRMLIPSIWPSNYIFTAVIKACAELSALRLGRIVHCQGLIRGEAFQYIQKLNPVKPAPSLWTAMLGACKMHKNLDVGVKVAEHLLAAEPENPGHYVLLSNIYALAGQMDRVEVIRNKMIQKGLKKGVGYCTIEVNRNTHLFSMGDKSHPKTIEIYKYLDELMQRIREAGVLYFAAVCDLKVMLSALVSFSKAQILSSMSYVDLRGIGFCDRDHLGS
ncbi:hypothetical protein U1Q18_009188 [Sarracenia purpurea var. burkii]